MIKEKEKQAYKALKDRFGYKNQMASPRLVKIIISAGIGSGSKKDPKRAGLVADRLSKITGQKPASRGAKKSIAGFKVRLGEPVGLIVTLRGKRMYNFADKLLNIALPRTKDFRGIAKSSVDNIGNLTIGIKEHTIFPETHDEELRDVFGFAITLVTTARGKEEALAYFETIGVPFKAKPSGKA